MERVLLNGEPVGRADLVRATWPLPIVALLDGMTSPIRQTGLCPHCGTDANSMQETSLVGCPLCYTVFESEISKLFTGQVS